MFPYRRKYERVFVFKRQCNVFINDLVYSAAFYIENFNIAGDFKGIGNRDTRVFIIFDESLTLNLNRVRAR